MKYESPLFLIVDDEAVNNLICSRLIELTIPNARVRTFTDPESAVEWICSQFSSSTNEEGILFLDINMPLVSGWDVLEGLISCNIASDRLVIYMLSSSVDTNDIKRAESHPLVSGFVVKSLSQQKLRSLFPHLFSGR
jgi:CheY-like chemotaxis protein